MRSGSARRLVEASTTHVRLALKPEGDAAQILRTNLRVDTNMDLLGAAVVAGLALWLDSTGGLIYAAIIAMLTLSRSLAFRAYRANDIRTGLLIVVFGTWALALPGVWLIPQGYPIHVVNVVSPLVLTVSYLSARSVRVLAVLGVCYIIFLGFLAFYHQGMVWAELFPNRAFEASIITSLTAVVLLFLLDVRDANIEMLRKVEQTRAADHAVRESRRRLTTVADAERVRIERNIHDGAQQQLIAMAVMLQLAAEQSTDPEHKALLSELHQNTQQAIADLRELAHGVYPAVLAARGLVEALRGVARRAPNQVIVESTGPMPLGQAEEVALYFVCLEALQNSAKHGGPDSTTTISFRSNPSVVEVVISDDGPGFDIDRVESPRGLLNMSDRVAALGGQLDVHASSGQGTRIVALVPTSPSLIATNA